MQTYPKFILSTLGLFSGLALAESNQQVLATQPMTHAALATTQGYAAKKVYQQAKRATWAPPATVQARVGHEASQSRLNTALANYNVTTSTYVTAAEKNALRQQAQSIVNNTYRNYFTESGSGRVPNEEAVAQLNAVEKLTVVSPEEKLRRVALAEAELAAARKGVGETQIALHEAEKFVKVRNPIITGGLYATSAAFGVGSLYSFTSMLATMDQANGAAPVRPVQDWEPANSTTPRATH